MGLKANILIQEYIKEAGGADTCCLVIGGKVVAAMKRQALPGEFRSNLTFVLDIKSYLYLFSLR